MEGGMNPAVGLTVRHHNIARRPGGPGGPRRAEPSLAVGHPKPRLPSGALALDMANLAELPTVGSTLKSRFRTLLEEWVC
jgi:hypothetical protein